MTTDRLPGRRAKLMGGLLLWFGVLGGALAWTVHVLAAWSIDELACAAGSSQIAGLPLRHVIGLAVLLPAAVTVASLMVSGRFWRRTGTRAAEGLNLARGRARLLALVGLASNLLFLTIIVLGGAAILVFPPCQR